MSDKNKSNLYTLPSVQDVHPDALLGMCCRWGVKEVVVIGIDEDDTLVWGSSSGNTRDVLFLIELAKSSLDL